MAAKRRPLAALLETHYDELKNELMASYYIDALYSKGVLSPADKEELESMKSTRLAQAKRFLDIMICKKESGIETFIQLVKSNEDLQPQLYDILYPKEEPCVDTGSLGSSATASDGNTAKNVAGGSRKTAEATEDQLDKTTQQKSVKRKRKSQTHQNPSSAEAAAVGTSFSRPKRSRGKQFDTTSSDLKSGRGSKQTSTKVSRVSLHQPITEEQLDVVALAASSYWSEIGNKLLGRRKCEDVTSPNTFQTLKASKKLEVLLWNWKNENGDGATLEKLLKVCADVGVKGAVESDLKQKNLM